MTPHPLEDEAIRDRIRQVAKQMRGRLPGAKADLRDVEQQLTLGVLQRLPRFDPACSTIEAFVTMAARCTAASMLRDATRAKRNPRRERRLAGQTAELLQAPDDTHQDLDDLRARVRRAAARMDEADADVADDLQRFGASGARNRLGIDRAQWVQTKERIGLTLAAEFHEKSRPNRAGRAGDGVSN